MSLFIAGLLIGAILGIAGTFIHVLIGRSGEDMDKILAKGPISKSPTSRILTLRTRQEL